MASSPNHLPLFRRNADYLFSFTCEEKDTSVKARKDDVIPIPLTGKSIEFAIMLDGAVVYTVTEADFTLSPDDDGNVDVVASHVIPRATMEALTECSYWWYLNVDDMRKADGHAEPLE